MVTIDEQLDRTIITLSPNRSSNWKDIKWALLILCLPALIIALGWFFVGVWVILPFAGLEIALLCFFMYKVCYKNYHQENINICKNSVIIESGIHHRQNAHTFSRPECYLSVSQPSSPLRNIELMLVDQANSITIGEFLNMEDRELARKALKNAGLIECSQQWWKMNKP